MVDSLRYLQNVGEQVQQTFLRNKTILSFQEYMEAYFERPRVHARDAAQYIRDCFDFYGSETVQRSSGPVRRFKLFDRPFDLGANSSQEGEGGAPICGQEDVQNAIRSEVRRVGKECRSRRSTDHYKKLRTSLP